MAGLILISGIHGAGKSTAAGKLTEKFLIPNYTASKIIKEMKNTISIDNSKLVSDIESNQKLLISGIHHLLQTHKDLILDGHFTLINKKLEIEKIDINVFRQLSLKGILLLQEQPETIHSRLQNRDADSMGLELITKHQLAEELHAEYVADQLKVPLKKLFNYNDKELFLAFESLQSF